MKKSIIFALAALSTQALISNDSAKNREYLEKYIPKSLVAQRCRQELDSRWFIGSQPSRSCDLLNERLRKRETEKVPMHDDHTILNFFFGQDQVMTLFTIAEASVPMTLIQSILLNEPREIIDKETSEFHAAESKAKQIYQENSRTHNTN